MRKHLNGGARERPDWEEEKDWQMEAGICGGHGGPGCPELQPQWPAGLLISAEKKVEATVSGRPEVVLSAEAFAQLFGWAYATSREISCLGVVRREGQTFTVERFHLVRQAGSAAHTEMDGEAVAGLIEKLTTEGAGDEARRLKCWGHSHPGMGVFWSGTDDATARLLCSDWLVSLVVSERFEILGRLDLGGPVPVTINQVPVVLPMNLDRAVIDARLLPITTVPEAVSQWRQPRHPVFAEGGRTAWRFLNSVTEAIKGRCLEALPRRTQALHGLLDVACGLGAGSS